MLNRTKSSRDLSRNFAIKEDKKISIEVKLRELYNLEAVQVEAKIRTLTKYEDVVFILRVFAKENDPQINGIASLSIQREAIKRFRGMDESMKAHVTDCTEELRKFMLFG